MPVSKGWWYNSCMERLKAGAEKLGIELNAGQLEQFKVFYEELVDWNRQINLTAITDYEEVQLKHFLDSLTVSLVCKPTKGKGVIDVGTGAGMPGIPLKIAFPDIKLVLLEATAKKVSFLHHIIQKLGLNGVEIIVGRAEEVAHVPRYRERFGLVLSRAVAALPTLIELTMPFCTLGGSFIAQKKGDVDGEVCRADKAISALGGKLRELKKIELAEFADERYLIVIDKIAPTPEEYPRRPGVPGKKPL
jgi:16S rRNA (guanine527-N7)-methyltransferase